MMTDKSGIEWTHNYECPQNLAEIDTDDLIYVVLKSVSSEALTEEQERCQEMVDLGEGGDSPRVIEWVDRVVIVEDMRRTKRQS